MKNRTITYLVWHDALAHEAASMEPTPAETGLAVLHEVGFLIAETDEVVTIGMELQEGQIHPGRWRLTVSKKVIVERHDVAAAQAFKKPRKRKSRIDKKEGEQTNEA